jgi:hypothetical protein
MPGALIDDGLDGATTAIQIFDIAREAIPLRDMSYHLLVFADLHQLPQGFLCGLLH